MKSAENSGCSVGLGGESHVWMWVVTQLWVPGGTKGVEGQRTPSSGGAPGPQPLWLQAAGRPRDPSFTPCCCPVARFGYCRGWACRGLQWGSSGLLWPSLQMPREGRDLASGHPGRKLGLIFTFRVECFPSALWCSGSPQVALGKHGGALNPLLEATSSRDPFRISSSRNVLTPILRHCIHCLLVLSALPTLNGFLF